MPGRKRAHPEIAEAAREHLGFESLRPGQEEAVRALLDGRDTLAVQPTGSGKSAIYQIAGLLIEGSTVIVSPLIALQKDQVDSLADQNAAEAVAVNSAQPAAAVREQLAAVDEGKIEFIFLAPEQLRKPETVENLKNAGISLFVVDEAHCISVWGHDFRPDYLRLHHVVAELGHPRILALTATASERVRNEIVERLQMRRPKILVQSFDRPNIFLRVDHFKTEPEKRDALVHRVRWADKPGIIYTGTRRAAEEIMRALGEENVDAVFYHAGLKAKDRHAIQERYMSGDAEVIVATNAFGMGVDKPDVRFVYHYDPSDSLDAYYQEIGRAGRDGKKSEAILFYRHQDIGAQSFKTGEGKIQEEVLQQVAEKIAANGESVDAKEVGLTPRKLTAAIQRLEDAGATSDGDFDPQEAARAAAEAHEERREGRKQRLEAMRDYAETTRCRREVLLQHFGDDFRGPCGFCDRCDPSTGEGTRREVV